MRVITTQKQQELLKRITACQIIINNIKGIDAEFYGTLTEHFTELAYAIGDIKGLNKVKNTVFGWKEVK